MSNDFFTCFSHVRMEAGNKSGHVLVPEDARGGCRTLLYRPGVLGQSLLPGGVAAAGSNANTGIAVALGGVAFEWVVATASLWALSQEFW